LAINIFFLISDKHFFLISNQHFFLISNQHLLISDQHFFLISSEHLGRGIEDCQGSHGMLELTVRGCSTTTGMGQQRLSRDIIFTNFEKNSQPW